MNKKEFEKDIEDTFKRCIAIVKIKNHDYSGIADPFGSFKNAELAGMSITQALVLNIIQKVSRLGNLIQRPAKVVSESIEDTILDCINYLAILLAYLHSKKK